MALREGSGQWKTCEAFGSVEKSEKKEEKL